MEADAKESNNKSDTSFRQRNHQEGDIGWYRYQTGTDIGCHSHQNSRMLRLLGWLARANAAITSMAGGSSKVLLDVGWLNYNVIEYLMRTRDSKKNDSGKSQVESDRSPME